MAWKLIFLREPRIKSICFESSYHGRYLGPSFRFAETQHGFRGPYRVARERARFLEKIPFGKKMITVGQKWPKNGALTFWEHYVFPKILVHNL